MAKPESLLAQPEVGKGQPLLEMIEVLIGVPALLLAAASIVFNLWQVFGG